MWGKMSSTKSRSPRIATEEGHLVKYIRTGGTFESFCKIEIFMSDVLSVILPSIKHEIYHFQVESYVCYAYSFIHIHIRNEMSAYGF